MKIAKGKFSRKGRRHEGTKRVEAAFDEAFRWLDEAERLIGELIAAHLHFDTMLEMTNDRAAQDGRDESFRAYREAHDSRNEMLRRLRRATRKLAIGN